jgi:hypothetical protein
MGFLISELRQINYKENLFHLVRFLVIQFINRSTSKKRKKNYRIIIFFNKNNLFMAYKLT